MFGYNEENKKHEFFPLRVGKVEKPDSHLNILLISNEQNNKHYCLIKNRSRLFSIQVNKHKEKIHFCNYCLQHFRNKQTLETHLEYCRKYKCEKTDYPSKGEKLKFMKL